MNEYLVILLNFLILYGYPFLAGIILLGYFGIPIPGEIFLLAAGALAYNGDLNIYFLIPFTVAVTLFGDSLIYYLGRKYGERIILKFGKRLDITHERIEKIGAFIDKWGMGAIFIAKAILTPLALPTTIFAGITKYPYKKYILAAFLGDVVWVSILVYLGYFFGANWVSLLDYISGFENFILIVSVSIIIFFITKKLRR